MIIVRSYRKVGLFRPLLYCVFFIIGLYSCSSANKEELRHDYYPSKTQLHYASNFKVAYFKSYKKVEVFENGDSLNPIQRYYLVEHGTKLPLIEEESEIIRIPLTSVSCMSTTQVSYLSLLNQLDKISGVGHASSIKDSIIQDQLAKGWTMEITRSGQLDKELILQSNTSLLMANSFDKSGLDDLKALDIPIIYSSEYSENTVLARAEWIKFFALFFNAEVKADKLFREIEKDYIETKEKIHTSQLPAHSMFGSYYQGLWFIPGGQSLMSSLLKDAGTNYVFENHATTKNIQVDTESLIDKIDKIDFWGMILTKEGTVDVDDFVGQDSRLKKAVSSQDIHFFYSNSNQNDYFGKACIEPHVLLKDLGKIFHPDLFPEHQFVYFQTVNQVD